MKKCCEETYQDGYDSGYDDGHSDGCDEGQHYCEDEVEELRNFLKEMIPALKRSRVPELSAFRKRIAKEFLIEEAM